MAKASIKPKAASYLFHLRPQSMMSQKRTAGMCANMPHSPLGMYANMPHNPQPVPQAHSGFAANASQPSACARLKDTTFLQDLCLKQSLPRFCPRTHALRIFQEVMLGPCVAVRVVLCKQTLKCRRTSALCISLPPLLRIFVME